MAHPVRSRKIAAASSLLLIPFLLTPIAAAAACVTGGLNTVCGATSPNPWTRTVGAGDVPSEDNRTITVNSGSTISTRDASAISLRDNANVTVQSGATVTNHAVDSPGNYGTGANTIEFGGNGQLTVAVGGKVISAGREATAEAVNLQGAGNVITNNGLIQATDAAAIWFQNDGGLNTVVNNATGVIQAPGSVIGSSANGAVDFTNRGKVIGDIMFAGGDDIMRFYTGSSVEGKINGGGGNNLIYLSGTGTAALTGDISGFQTLIKNDAGTWTLSGILSDVQLARVADGTLVLTGNNANFPGQVVVDTPGTLEARAQSLPSAVEDNGLVRFAQPDAGVYRGLISGTGAVEKTGAGTLTLAPAAVGGNTYAGGTRLTDGTVNIAADNALGAATGGITFNGGTLQLGADLNLAATRAISLDAGGGTIDTQQYSSVLAQSVTGTGGLTKLGSGSLTLNGASTYGGGTTVSAGTLAVGDAQHSNATIGAGLTTVAAGATLGGYGSVLGSVDNSGTIAAANALPVFAAAANGAFTIGGDLVNNHTINLAAASGHPGNVLNVGGNYVGNNSQLILNTLMNEGGAEANQFTDRLVIGGNASGSTSVVIIPTGLGALTVGDGIKVVQVNGSAAPSTFHMMAPVQAGAYQYLLYQGGAARPSDFFLRSSLESTPDDPSDPSGNPPPVTQRPGTVPLAGNSPAPIAYRPAVVGYSITPALNLDYGFTILNRLHERVGDVANLENAQGTKSGAVWGRIGGQSLNANTTDRFSTDERTFFAQFGKDWTLSRGVAGGSTHAGVMVTLGSSSATFDDSARSLNPTLTTSTGTAEMQAQSLGGYWTKYLHDGSYFDAVAQFTHYHNKYGDIYGGSGSQNGFGTGLSGEVGKPLMIGSSGIAVGPQAQLLYQYLHLNGFGDNVSPVSGNSTNALRGRVGFRLFKANLTSDSKTGTATPYFTADVLHDFFSPGNTTVDSTSFADGLAKTWYELGVGVTTSMGKTSALYANVKYARNLGGDYRRGVFGQVGYRYSW